ncbi:PAAR domain-containing protein [Bosea sp. Tri-44]|uniref:PAAR domain-containing protein n=1 Tax=Bosea sp. Tri-44 TaxID=1972137 RepID=UPI0020BF373E|nr:PAAR domain-containing protein [Bosea sp. Tri-44]
MTTAADAIARLGGKPSVAELIALAREVPATATGPGAILYSRLGSKAAKAEDVVAEAQEATGYALIDDTPRAAFLMSRRFQLALAEAFGLTGVDDDEVIEKLQTGSWLPATDPQRAAATAANELLYGVEGDAKSLQDSFWGDASREFIESLEGPVHVMLMMGQPVQKVFWAVELPAVLAAAAAGKLASNATINGVPVASLPANRDAAFAVLTASADRNAKAFMNSAAVTAAAAGGAGAGGGGGGGGGGGRPAARILDPVIHPLPGVLQPGPGSFNVIIGGKLAWRGVPAGAAAAIQSAKAVSDAAIQVAEAATLAAAGTPGAPVAKAAEETAKATAAASMGSMISGAAGGADIHLCATPLPLPPHGPGVVIDGSQTVLVNGLPLCRMGDTIIEAVGPPNKIAMGEPTVLIGG